MFLSIHEDAFKISIFRLGAQLNKAKNEIRTKEFEKNSIIPIIAGQQSKI